MSLLNLTCEISIGSLVFTNNGVNSVEIDSTWKNLTDTCTITLAKRIYVNKDGKNVRLASVIRIGQKVLVKLGYNGNNKVEFEGFVSGIRAKTPFEIDCQDGMWLLKRKSITGTFGGISWRSFIEKLLVNAKGSVNEPTASKPTDVIKTKVPVYKAPDIALAKDGSASGINPASVITTVSDAPKDTTPYESGFNTAALSLTPQVKTPEQQLAESTAYLRNANPLFFQTTTEKKEQGDEIDYWISQIRIVEDYPWLDELTPGNYNIPLNAPKTAAQILEEVKKQMGQYFWFRGLDLHTGLRGGVQEGFGLKGGYVIYLMNWNVISHNLTYQEAQDVRLKVQVITTKKNGDKSIVEAGGYAYGNIRKLPMTRGMSEVKMRELAQQYLKRYMYDGFRGDFTAFGEPYCRHGDYVDLRDLEGEMSGVYMVNGTKVSFGESGFRRVVKLGPLEDSQ
jgi:hypothetical protein